MRYIPRSLTQQEVENWPHVLADFVNPTLLDCNITDDNKKTGLFLPVFAFDLSIDVYETNEDSEPIIVDHLLKFSMTQNPKNKEQFFYDLYKNEVNEKYFDLVVKSDMDQHELQQEYRDFSKFMNLREDQFLSMLISNIDEQKKTEQEKSYDDGDFGHKNNEEAETIGDESLISDASELKNIIITEWNETVLGTKSGNFDHDMELALRKQDYFNTKVYDRAWEVKDLIMKLLDAKYLAFTQVVIPENEKYGIDAVDYRKIYKDIQEPENHGKNACRLLVSLSRLMGKCVHRSISFEEVETIESEIPQSSNIGDA
jgi:hypothetical protein